MLLSSWTTEVVALFYSFPTSCFVYVDVKKSLCISRIDPQVPSIQSPGLDGRHLAMLCHSEQKLIFYGKRYFSDITRPSPNQWQENCTSAGLSPNQLHFWPLGSEIGGLGQNINFSSIHSSIYHQLTKGKFQRGSTDLTKHCFYTAVCWRGKVKGERPWTNLPLSPQHLCQKGANSLISAQTTKCQSSLFGGTTPNPWEVASVDPSVVSHSSSALCL